MNANTDCFLSRTETLERVAEEDGSFGIVYTTGLCGLKGKVHTYKTLLS